MLTFREICERLHARRNGAGMVAPCPSHDDKEPSLTLSEGAGGRTLLHCHAGCDLASILKAANLTMADINPPKTAVKEIVATYDYVDENGGLLFQVVRYQPKAFKQRVPDGKGSYTWKTAGLRKVPYRLPELLRSSGPVFIVEGEKDVDAAYALGVTATCNAMGACKWTAEHAAFLKGYDTVIIPDADDTGRKHGRVVAASLKDKAKSIKLTELPGSAKDLSDWIAAGGRKDTLLGFAESLPEYVPPAVTELPIIVLAVGEHPVALDQTEQALLPHATRLGLFQRAGEVVRLIRLAENTEDGKIRRPAGSMIFSSATSLSLLEDFERCASFVKIVLDKDGNEKYRRINCPPKFAATYLQRSGMWNLPAVTGIIFTPTLRNDGTVLDVPGFDPRTGLYLSTDTCWPPIPAAPTKDEAIAAIKKLSDPFARFPWCSDADRSVLLAGILTAVVRRTLQACPLFGFTAPVMRSGKSLLTEAIGIIATGIVPAATAMSDDENELKKAILSLLKAGDSVILLDNVEHTVRSPQLNIVITQANYQDRVLGESEMRKYPTNAMWCITGNNLSVSGDLISRTLLCAIDAKMEHPENREFDVDLKPYLIANRIELVIAALTVLRAYITTGKREPQGGNWGGFENWYNLIRGSLVWCGQADPCKTREAVATEDPALENAARVFAAIAGCGFQDEAFTVPSLIARSKEAGFAELSQCLLAVAGVRGEVNPERLGKWLKRWRDRIVEGFQLKRIKGETDGRKRWEVTQPRK